MIKKIKSIIILSIAVFRVTKKSIPDIAENVEMIVNKTTGNPDFTEPLPKLSDITERKERMNAKYQAALKGGKDNKFLMRLAKREMVNDMRIFTAYVQSVSGGDETKILSTGLEIKRPRTPRGELPPPAKFRSNYGKKPGEIIIRWGGVYGRTSYRLQINDTPGDEAKWRDLVGTGKNRYLAEGLNVATMYGFRIATISVKGQGPWSETLVQRSL